MWLLFKLFDLSENGSFTLEFSEDAFLYGHNKGIHL